MQQVAGEMQKFFVEQDLNLLVQGGGAPRTKLLEQFKSTPRSVLFGTDSFWSGVDVPGEALSNVIITRLPFAVPDHAVDRSQTRTDSGPRRRRVHRVLIAGSNPEISTRRRPFDSHNDRSRIVVILDNRIVTKPYGRAFMQALPKCPVDIL